MLTRIFNLLRRGRLEARARIESDLDLIAKSGLFDADWYCAKYPEVRAGKHDPHWHFCTLGAAADYDPNRLFDAAWYRARNPESGSNPLAHFLRHGIQERRSPSGDFDLGWYLDTYEDITMSGMNPLDHFMNYGESDGRDPNPSFSTSFYRDTYMQTSPLDASPIDHYRRIGRALGHQTMPVGLQPQTHRRLALAQSFGLEIPELLRHIDLMLVRPFFFCVVADATPDSSLSAEERLTNQIYPDWALCASVEDAIRQGSSLEYASWFVVLLNGESELSPSAMYCFASAINGSPLSDVITCDVDSDGLDPPSLVSGDPTLDRPAPHPRHLLVCVSGPALSRILDESVMPSSETFLRRVAEVARETVHIPRALAYRDTDRPRPPTQVAGTPAPKRSTNRVDQAVAAARRHTYRPEGRTAIVYLARGAGNDWRPRFDRFVRSYREFEAGATHDLVVVFKGFESENALRQARAAFDGVTYEALELDDLGFDIGAYAEAAMHIACDRICFLNTNSEIVSANWLIKMIANLEQPGIGIVGATGSHEAHRGSDTRFPPFPNIHVRTNAFMMRRSDACSIFGGLQIRSKHDAHMAEHGFNSITRQIVDRGLAPLVVGRNGRGYAPQWWAGSQTYRVGAQGNVLIHDNQTRFYEAISREHQTTLRIGAWGVPNDKVPFLEATP